MKGLIPLSAVALLLLAGCSRPPSAPSEPGCGNDFNAEQCRYLHTLSSTLQAPFNATVAKRFPGKGCTVTAQRQPDGHYNVLRTEGDEALCLRAWKQVSSARDLPLPPVGIPSQMRIGFGAVQ